MAHPLGSYPVHSIDSTDSVAMEFEVQQSASASRVATDGSGSYSWVEGILTAGKIRWAATALAAAVFAIDRILELGVAGGVPYVAVVVLSLRLPQREVYSAAVGCSVLTVVGFFVSPLGGEVWKVASNRILALFAIWVTALLGSWAKRSERAAAELRRQQAVDDATRASRRRIYESEKLAATGRMAAGIGHQINNPLAAIKNSFLLLQDAIPANHRHARFVPLIHRQIDRISRIAGQMSELCPEREAPSWCAIGDLLVDVVDLLDPSLQENEISVCVDLPEPIVAWLPEGSLRQVAANVLQNAIDASPRRGSIEIQATATRERLTLVVRDHGCGIPKELASQVFEPFFTTKQDPQGARPGLGLPISQRLTEDMGGSLTFDSPPNDGTVFRVELPLPDTSGGRVAASG